MNKRTILEKVGDFVLGKGFYIVLALCVAAIGISGYYFLSGTAAPPEDSEPVTGTPTLVLPDAQADTPQWLEEEPALNDRAEAPAGTEEPSEAGTEPAGTEDGGEEAAAPLEQEPERPAWVVYTWPVKGEILRDFSVETLSLDPTLGDWRTHGGLDIAAGEGLEVVAMCPGTVSAVYDDGLMGTTVVIDHGDGLTAVYCNLAEKPSVESGDAVDTGTVIGNVGSTAIAESGLASHLHLEVSLNGELVDPREFLPET